jgi:hypothetical protein
LLIEIVAISMGLALWAAAWRATPSWCARHLLRTFSIVRPEQLWLARALRIWLWLAGFSALALVRPCVSAWASRRSGAQVVRAVAILGLGLIGVFAIGELILRITTPDPSTDTQMPPGMAEQDQSIGWRLVRSHETRVQFRGRAIAYAINAAGERASSIHGKAEPDTPTLLFIGESITFGWGLDYGETYPARIGRALGMQAVNLGVPAYGNDQAYARLEAALPRFANVRAVVGLFLPVQLDRNLAYWRPRLVEARGGALAHAPAEPGLLAHLRLRWLWHNVGYRAQDRGVHLAASLARHTAALAARRGARALFVVPSFGPDRTADQRPEHWVINQVLERQGLEHTEVDLERPELHLRDQHPNTAGAAKIAQAIVRSLGEPHLPSSSVTR